MANAPDIGNCNAALEADGPAAPFTSLSYHFGMLLGVTDFETEQSYHRSKLRLHSAWLHGPGVVWGFAVNLDTAHGEIQVKPGLALDGAGRELHLDAEACLDVAAWFNAHKKDAGFVFSETALQIQFDAHVVLRFKACLTRQVPALAEPCDNAAISTAYSRIYETVEILLVPGKAPARVTPYHRLRLLFGLDAPTLDSGGKVVAGDQDVLDARKDLDSFRRFAALDVTDLRPPGDHADLSVVLADVAGIALTKAGAALTVAAGTVDPTVRPSHVATSTIEELLNGAPQQDGTVTVKPGTVKIDEGGNTVTFDVTADLATKTVTPAAFSLTHFDDPTGWTARPVTDAKYDSGTVTVTFTGAIAGKLVRFIATASGPAPILGTDLLPFNHGRDFVHSKKRS